MFSVKAAIQSVVEQGRRAVLLATRSKNTRINLPGNNNHLKLSESQFKTGVGKPGPKGVNSNQLCSTEVATNSVTVISPGGGIVNLLRPVTTRIVQGLVRRVSSPLWAEARRKSAKRLFGETAPYFALVGVTLVSGPERGLLTAQDELEAVCGDIREAISRAGWIHNPNFWIDNGPCENSKGETTSNKGFSLSDFDFGSAISKGCNAVVYATKWKENSQTKDASPEVCERENSNTISSKIASNPPKLVDSLEDIFTNGSLWSLKQIQSNSGAIPKPGLFSTRVHANKESFSSDDDDKTLSDGATDDTPSDTSTEELNFNLPQNRELDTASKSIANSTEEFLNLSEGYSLTSLDTIPTPSAGLGLGARHSVSLSEDVDLLLSTGGFHRTKGKGGQKRKKVKFKVEEKEEEEEEDINEPTPIPSPTTNDTEKMLAGVSSSLEEYPLAMKMMFNYEAESNAPAILTAMYKEMLPAKTLQLDDVSSVWKKRLLNTTTSLPPHVNIVDMPCVFVDRIPLLADGFSLYPDALPRRINPSGYGRNMSLFCVMKRYDCTVAEYLKQHVPNVRTSLLLLTQMLESINHLTKYNVAHRDLKSDNLLLCLREGIESPHLVVSDFGCCLADPSFKVAFSSYETDPRVGNAALMAPEIKGASPGIFTWLNYNKADLWSAGTLAYELFGLENPFAPRCNRGNANQSGKKVVMLDSSTYKESQLPRLPKTFPAEIRCLIHDLLRRNPNQRPSATIAATICQLSLWGPRKWLNRHALTMPSNNEVMRWLLCLSTKVLCEAGSTPSDSSASKSEEGKVMESGGGQLEYEIVSTFLKRVHYNDIIQAIKWIRAF